jgi:hypothetical protein
MKTTNSTLAAKLRLRSLTSLALLAAALPDTASAATVYWNMQSAVPTSNNALNLTVSNLSRGNNNGTTTLFGTTSASSGYSFALEGTSTPASGSNNAAAAARSGPFNAATSAFFEFTMNPAAGFTGNLSALGFATRSTSSGPSSMTLRSSLDNYASSVASFTGTTNGTWTYQSATLAAPLTFSENQSVTFRLFGFGNGGSASANTANWRIDDLKATVATLAVTPPSTVPEPATAMSSLVVSTAGIALVSRRRRTLR